jgi:hypothetical protein
MVHKIALEEHFLPPGFEDYWRPTVRHIDPKHATKLLAALTDFGEARLSSMDEAGIARAVLGLAGPSATSQPRSAMRNPPMIFLRRRSSSAPTVIPASRILPCKMRTRRPTNWSAACAN